MTSRRETLVLDTNLVVSAFLRPDGTAAQAVRKALLGFDVAASRQTLDELHDVLSRDKFDRYLPRLDRLQYAKAYAEAVRLVEVTRSVADCADP
ncbi:MAG: putative toxin-antitoxin system toxin component, PIN family [Burkholderiaceae bacterium]